VRLHVDPLAPEAHTFHLEKKPLLESRCAAELDRASGPNHALPGQPVCTAQDLRHLPVIARKARDLRHLTVGRDLPFRNRADDPRNSALQCLLGSQTAIVEGPMREFSGRVAVVTGAASGIGFALVEKFAAEGMKVVLADIEEPALLEAEQKLQSGGAETLAVKTDVGRMSSVEALADAVYHRFGAVHILCNNAGVSGGVGPTWTLSQDDWKWTLGVNLWGVIHGARAFVPRMLAGKQEGHIVNTASIMGLVSMPMCSAYAATKFAVTAVSESLAMELAQLGAPIRVSVLCPAAVATRIVDSDRNRPRDLAETGMGSEAASHLKESIRAAIAAGYPPAHVANEVFEAIRAERFYILTHPETKAAVRARLECVLDGSMPPPPQWNE